MNTLRVSLRHSRAKECYHIKNLATGKIYSFSNMTSFVAHVKACKDNTVDDRKLSIYFNELLGRTDDNILKVSRYPKNRNYVVWKGDLKTGLYVTSERIVTSPKIYKAAIFLIDFKERTIKKYTHVEEISAVTGLIGKRVYVWMHYKKPFGKGRYFCVKDYSEGRRLLSQYKEPVRRVRRRILSIKVYDLTSSKVETFSSASDMAAHYGLNLKGLRDRITSIASHFKDPVKVPTYENLTFSVEFDR